MGSVTAYFFFFFFFFYIKDKTRTRRNLLRTSGLNCDWHHAEATMNGLSTSLVWSS